MKVNKLEFSEPDKTKDISPEEFKKYIRKTYIKLEKYLSNIIKDKIPEKIKGNVYLHVVETLYINTLSNSDEMIQRMSIAHFMNLLERSSGCASIKH